MKKQLPFLLILVFTLLAACKKKPISTPADYRKKYVGEYQMTYYYNYWVYSGSEWSNHDTTIQYTGTLDYNGTDKISFDWYNNTQKTFKVSQNGQILSDCDTQIGSINQTEFNLTYTDDLCTAGPLGFNFTLVLHGVKE